MDAWILRVSDNDVCAVEVDCVKLGGVVGEAGCVEVTLIFVSTSTQICNMSSAYFDCTNGKDEV